jgi:hypothetical protein
MRSPNQDKHGSRLEVRSDYLCLATEYDNLDALNELLQKPPLAETGLGFMKPADVADQRRERKQQLLSAALHSSGSQFIFPVPTPPQSAADPGQRMEGRSQAKHPVSGLYVRVVRIEETRAPLGDGTAVATLLASTPLPPVVEPLLHKPFFERKWECIKQRDHWIASDGATVVSVTISGASPSAVARMRLRFDDLRIVSPGLQPSLKILHDLLEEIAGVTPSFSC